MAGISLTLRRMVRGNTALGWFGAGGYALLVATGPWVISMIAVAFIAKLLGGKGSERAGFFLSITYSQATSQVLFMPLLMAFMRHVADGLYLRRHAVIGESLISALLIVPVLSLPAVFLFGWDSPALTLAMMAGANAFVGACLGACHRHLSVVAAYVAGYTISCAGVMIVLSQGGDDNACARGFLAGQCVLFIMLLMALRSDLKVITHLDFGWLKRLRTMPTVALGGLGVSVGLWAEKVIYWRYAPDRVITETGLSYCPNYDFPMFLAMLSATPGVAFFVLQLETGFADAMEKVSDRLSRGAPLDQIESAHETAKLSAVKALALLLRTQAVITLFGLFFTEAVLAGTGVGAVQTGVWRVAFVGVFFFVLFVSIQTLLYYVNATLQAALTGILLIILNVGLSFAFLKLGPAYHGVGFMIASALSALIAFFTLLRALVRLPIRMFNM